MPTGDGLLARLHPPLGILSTGQARAVAQGARRFGNGHLDLTARANLQIRGVTEATRVRLARHLEAVGLGDVRADGGPQRLTLTGPFAGHDPDDMIDVPALARAIEAVGRDVAGLPAKILVVVGGRPGVALPEADLYAVARDAGKVGIAAASHCGMQDLMTCTERDAPGLVGALLAAFSRTGQRRMRDLPQDTQREMVHAIGLTKRLLVPASAQAAGCSAIITGEVPFAPPAGLLRVGPDRQALALDAPFGRCTANALDRVAAAAEAIGAEEIRLSPARGFVLLAPAGVAAAAVLASLAADFIVARDDPRRRIEACTGAPGCASGSTPTLADAARLAGPFRPFAAQGRVLHVSGCAKGCARPGQADLTLVGRNGLYGANIGGGPGDEPAIDLPIEAVLKRLGRAEIVGLAAAFAPDIAEPEDERDGTPA
jgi:precorrin-3B synthase